MTRSYTECRYCKFQLPRSIVRGCTVQYDMLLPVALGRGDHRWSSGSRKEGGQMTVKKDLTWLSVGAEVWRVSVLVQIL